MVTRPIQLQLDKLTSITQAMKAAKLVLNLKGANLGMKDHLNIPL